MYISSRIAVTKNQDFLWLNFLDTPTHPFNFDIKEKVYYDALVE